jgi:hypothetical protein
MVSLSSLKDKYSFAGRVYCNMGTAETARTAGQCASDGSRAAGRRVIETDWKYDPSQVTNTSSSRPLIKMRIDHRRKDQPHNTPNLQARDFAIKEGRTRYRIVSAIACWLQRSIATACAARSRRTA